MSRIVHQPFVLPSMCNITREPNQTDGSKAWGATVLSPLLMCLAGTIGNIVALVVLHRTKSRGVFYILVAGLAWTDLLGIILTTPATIATYANGREWVGGEVFCKFNGFLMVSFGFVTPLIACAMAIERLLSVQCTFTHSRQCNRGSARVTIVVLWITVMVLGILPLFGFGRYSVQYPCTWCFLDFHSDNDILNAYAYVYASMNLAIILIMDICNVYVMVTLLRVRYLKQKTGSHLELTYNRGSKKKKKQKSLELQMFILLFAITCVFTICWVPLMIHILVTVITGESNHFVDLVTIRLASLNQILDPWMYILLRKSFIRRMVRITKRMFCVAHSRTSDTDDVQNRNLHAHHLRCYRKLCHMPAPHYHLQGHITPSGRCVVQFKRRSKSKSKSSEENQAIKKSLPDVMKDAHTRSPSIRPDVPGMNENEELCMQCQSIHFTFPNNTIIPPHPVDCEASAYENEAMTQKHETTSSGDESDTSQSKPCEMCTGAMPSRTMEQISDDDDSDEEDDTNVFLTKTTDLSTDQLGALPQVVTQARRGKLNSEVYFPCSYFRNSGKTKRRTKSSS